jgi:hypothetical protein
MITDGMRREAAELALRLPAWADAHLRNALREIAFTPFIRSIDEEEWRALAVAAREEIEAAEAAAEEETDEDREDERQSRAARMIYHGRAR